MWGPMIYDDGTGKRTYRGVRFFLSEGGVQLAAV